MSTLKNDKIWEFLYVFDKACFVFIWKKDCKDEYC